ncbi:hypothetical protein MJO28_008294 [Puccinia striiformis f. sp. tritici]|uniref:Uncharacterized protein n=1 Tax=Puccinia striiformis f. sp. tritici TaxID=168172 RepID=A0ACC0EBE6_9BASI|nr:hypothetical protein MJO28_008294 [Puccinia striiformis f. sp. tritici]
MQPNLLSTIRFNPDNEASQPNPRSVIALITCSNKLPLISKPPSQRDLLHRLTGSDPLLFFYPCTAVQQKNMVDQPAHFSTSDANESRVLVLYTGGTIGMLSGPQGYSPLAGYLSEHLRSQPRFHDPSSSSLCTNSQTVDAFRSWQSLVSLNSPSSTSPSPTYLSTKNPASPSSAEAVPVTDENSRFNGNQLKVITENGPQWLDSLVMQESHGCPKIRYAILEYERLIDSSEIEISDYLRICNSIQSNYYLFDSFVILHGTDTMAYTASAISFLLENLGKNVILTGAQIPLSCPRNDAVENLLGALQISGTYLIPEVSLYFNHRLWRGNRSMKVNSVEFDAFKSFNLEPLVKIGCNVEVRWDLISRPVERQAFRVHQAMCENVAVLRLFPSITPASVRAFLASPIQGIVLETFGSGNAPRKPELLKAFKEAADRGVVIVNVTQCVVGTVSSDIYETGRALAEVGITGGRDMTTECALAKLAYLLSKPSLTPEKIRTLISQPLRGELTLPARVQFQPQPVEDRLNWLMKHITSLKSSSHEPLQSPDPNDGIANMNINNNNPHTPSATISNDPTILLKRSPNLGRLSIYQDVGVELETSEMLQKEQDLTEQSLLPIALTAASAREDASLSSLLEICHDQIQIHGLLNLRSASGLGQTALHLAAFYGRFRNIELLLDHGASVHLRDDIGHTALFYAINNHHKTCVDFLVKAGAHLTDFEQAEDCTSSFSHKNNSSTDLDSAQDIN